MATSGSRSYGDEFNLTGTIAAVDAVQESRLHELSMSAVSRLQTHRNDGAGRRGKQRRCGFSNHI